MKRDMNQAGVSTPWGLSQGATLMGAGVIVHDTASHGGVWLSDERHAALQAKFRYTTFAGGQWYEEDCDYCAVVIAFPCLFSTQRVIRAMDCAKTFKSWEERDGNKDSGWHRVVEHCKTDPTLVALTKERESVLQAE